MTVPLRLQPNQMIVPICMRSTDQMIVPICMRSTDRMIVPMCLRSTDRMIVPIRLRSTDRMIVPVACDPPTEWSCLYACDLPTEWSCLYAAIHRPTDRRALYSTHYHDPTLVTYCYPKQTKTIVPIRLRSTTTDRWALSSTTITTRRLHRTASAGIQGK